MLDLKDVLKGRIVIVCLGNIDRGDDGIGPRLAAIIKGKSVHEVIDAGVAPENHTGIIIRFKPDTIIMVDAVDFDGRAGEARLFSSGELRSGKISTHDVSPKLLIEYLKSYVDAEIYLLGIKPVSNKFGEGLSKEAERALRDLEHMFLAK
ncbi:hydrogenase 3 maturation endopeptidase HyCI [Candidatus Omnitrophota bacterium]